ncbi:MAG TPA: thiamine pyrophosphate-dependent enzyme [Spirochaetia bacterium]|nr:thiamine pyrophosphate-dependent enzyme [Spirochaetia bacterium]
MPKSIVVDPRETRRQGKLSFMDIPLNLYTPDIRKETEKYGRETLVGMYRDMAVIREFETMLNTIKTKGAYQGIPYDHLGPAHLSIGQESAVVGQCLPLGIDDFIFGSHRSHGEIIAKCLSAIAKLPEAQLSSIMETYMGGAPLRVVQKGRTGPLKELAVDYALYGTLAEIFGRENGFNRGMGGSMHAFFAPFGSMPNNAIVGGSGDIAVGAALFKRINRKPGIVIANIGDGSSACGPVWEAMMVAAMDQYRTLWPKDIGGAPPIIFNFFNNFYGMGGQTMGETMGFKVLARIGAGVNPDQMHAERVDGYNPLAVADAVERKRKVLAEGRGPVLLDVVTYRYSGHSPSDASSYRTKEEVALWQDVDCIKSFGEYLVAGKVAKAAELEAIQKQTEERMRRITELAVSLEVSPRIATEPDAIGDMMFSNGNLEKAQEGTPELLMPVEKNPRVTSNAKKSRSGVGPDGKPLPKAQVISLRDAIFEAMLHRFAVDPSMVAFGEENRDWGGAFAVYRGLTEALPYHRLFNTPISEGAIVGAAVGYAMCGGRVVPELMYCDFLGRSGDEVFNQVCKWQSMSAGVLKMPLVLRVSVGSKYGAQHSQDWTSLVAHIPGLKVMFPATPYDAKGMLNLALRGTDPVVFFESQRIYDIGELFVPGGVPEGYYEVPEGRPAVRREGSDLTLVSVGATLYRAIEAADVLASKYGVSAEVIDARFINPLDYAPIVESIEKTGRCVLTSDACDRGSFLHTMASTLSQMAFDSLDAPITVVGARNWITPAAEMEDSFFPQKEWIVDAIHERVLPLPGHAVSTNQSMEEMARRNRRGV